MNDYISEENIIKILKYYIKDLNVNKKEDLKLSFLELSVTSLMFVEIIVILEKIYGVEFPDTELIFEENRNIYDLITICKNLFKRK